MVTHSLPTEIRKALEKKILEKLDRDMVDPVALVTSVRATEFVIASFSSTFTTKVGLRIHGGVTFLVFDKDSQTFFWSAGTILRKFTIGETEMKDILKGNKLTLYLNIYKGVLFYKCSSSSNNYIGRITIATGKREKNWYECKSGLKIFYMTIGGDLLCLVEGDYEQTKLICSKLPEYKAIYIRQDMGYFPRVAISYSMGKLMLIWSATNKENMVNDKFEITRIDIDTKKELCHQTLKLDSRTVPVLVLHKSVLYFPYSGTKGVYAVDININCSTSRIPRVLEYPLPVKAPANTCIMFAFL